MKEEDYIFIAEDAPDMEMSDAVVIDMNQDGEASGYIFIDEAQDGSDFITIAEDTEMMSDIEMFDMGSIDIDGLDIEILI
ncbi:MAG: hypothetical protein LUD02_12240 [Tannerellaceae bacterium]|nr:hypothetical protein [Tannerellaceae bacterium]